MKKFGISAPSRIYDSYPGGHFSMSEMVDYMSAVGFDGIDMSFENIGRFDDAVNSVLYSAASRAEKRGLTLSSCHLPFYMPDPDGQQLMTSFLSELKKGIDAAALMNIGYAVTHPVAYHSQRRTYEEWLEKNKEFLSPVIEYARKKGVKICIENMASANESEKDHLYGCTAEEILILAKMFDCGVCWDFGHANLSGLSQSGEIEKLGGKLCVVHIHDNDGKKDTHFLPFSGNIDWTDAMMGLKNIGYCGFFDMEVKSSELPADREIRTDYGRKTVFFARKLINMARINK